MNLYFYSYCVKKNGRELEIELEFVHLIFAKCNNFSKGSSEPKKDAKSFDYRGRKPHKFLNSNYLFL